MPPTVYGAISGRNLYWRVDFLVHGAGRIVIMEWETWEGRRALVGNSERPSPLSHKDGAAFARLWRSVREGVACSPGGRTPRRRRADAGPRLGVLAVVHHSAGAKGVSVLTTNKRLGPRPRPFFQKPGFNRSSVFYA